MGTKARKPTAPPGERQTSEDLPERWSVQRKTELVLRLLRGEPVDTVSRESQIPAHELESWKRVFLEAGARVLKSRTEPGGDSSGLRVKRSESISTEKASRTASESCSSAKSKVASTPRRLSRFDRAIQPVAATLGILLVASYQR